MSKQKISGIVAAAAISLLAINPAANMFWYWFNYVSNQEKAEDPRRSEPVQMVYQDEADWYWQRVIDYKGLFVPLAPVVFNSGLPIGIYKKEISQKRLINKKLEDEKKKTEDDRLLRKLENLPEKSIINRNRIMTL
jgi:hypothetical protein